MSSIFNSQIPTERVAKWCVYLALINTLLAVLYLGVLLTPEPGLHSDIFSIAFAGAQFPGTWMFIAFLIHIMVGILGMVAWAAVYYLSTALFKKENTNKLLSYVSVGGTFLGVLISTWMYFLAGFIGGRAMLPADSCFVLIDGCLNAGVAIVNALISWTVIPTGAGMGIAALATVVGLLNIFLTLRK
jgi:MFS family permease|tara:strand:+ start:284 stop:844 length:561 start_codon:yes stop_codon:yes gene_type:complete